MAVYIRNENQYLVCPDIRPELWPDIRSNRVNLMTGVSLFSGGRGASQYPDPLDEPDLQIPLQPSREPTERGQNFRISFFLFCSQFKLKHIFFEGGG